MVPRKPPVPVPSFRAQQPQRVRVAGFCNAALALEGGMFLFECVFVCVRVSCLFVCVFFIAFVYLLNCVCVSVCVCSLFVCACLFFA